jgi:EAL domain-containing protein (putative c-di-GMP-specific phosphodiesterase class I)/DNA-binding NarL/FixJ family response regulator
MSWSVLVVDDDPIVLAVVSAVIDGDPRFDVIRTARDAEGAIAAAQHVHPDLALVDVVMPGGGPHAVRGIAAVSPATRIVALSGNDDAASVRAMLDAGAHRYTVKATPPEELLELLAAVMVAEPRPEPIWVTDPPLAEPAGVLLALGDSGELLALADALAREPGLEVVGLAQTPAHAATLATRHCPAVAIVDAALQPGGGAYAASLVRSASPETAIISIGEDVAPLDLLRSGTRGHLSGARPADVAAAVRKVAAGGAALSARAAAVLLEELVARLDRDHVGAAARELGDRLDRALGGDAMLTLVQPVVDLRDGRPVGHEALTRFTLEPAQAPDAWFAQAASVGRGSELELAAASRALGIVDELPDYGWLSINMSPAVVADGELEPLLPDELSGRVVLEMTEHAPVRDYGRLIDALDRLRERGVRVAVDDAGAGFASLRHIVLVAPDFIKLDMSLCRGIDRDPARRAMARALAGFAAETGSTVIAEGLESDTDVEALRELEVTLGQGYALGRPTPAGKRARFRRD